MSISQNQKLLLAHTATKIKSRDLISFLKQHAENITTLSLDCFDTLLWRKTASPVDVFHLLQDNPIFKARGLTAESRTIAETKARQRKLFIQPDQIEVTLAEIYQTSHSRLTDDEIAALCEAELTAEMQVCYAFPPMVELIRAADILGKEIIIVSDTYFREAQLRRLLQHCLPEDAYSAIKKVICSCDYSTSKVNGLFNKVIKELKQAPEDILHIGNSLLADYVAARCVNLHALHFIQEDEEITNLFRLQTIAAHVMDPAVRQTKPLLNLYRGIFAASQQTSDKPETLIGFAALGPLMHAFAQFVLRQVNALQEQTGQRCKVLFLMRDAYLPMLACEALQDEKIGHAVRISRFAACAAAFRTEKDIENYLLNNMNAERLPDIARQLLLPEKVSEPLIRVALRDQYPARAFVNSVLRKDVTRIIMTKSAEYRARLLCHLNIECNINLSAGDTVLFVDLGYRGTTQTQLTPLLNDIGVNVFGCYLIATRTEDWEKSRCGLLDPASVDDYAAHMLVNYIALLEQLCTSPEQSVIDYDAQGKPIFSNSGLTEQHGKSSLIQQECLRFVREANAFFAAAHLTLSNNELTDAAKTGLARMIFLSTAHELQYLQSFNFDLNIGTNDILKLFDPEKGLTGMRRRGLNFMERNINAMRTNYPTELRAVGFEFSMLLMLQNRYRIDMNEQDMLQRKIPLQCVLTRGNEKHTALREASATHDGFYSIWLPVGKGDVQASILFGEQFQWVQIESAELIQIDAFAQQRESHYFIDAWYMLSFVGMNEQGVDKSGRLFACGSEAAQVVVNPNMQHATTEYVFRLVFRPVVGRK